MAKIKSVKQPADPRKVVGYIRVSTDDQSLSVAAQRETLAGWCKAKGCSLVAVHVDEGVSGACPVQGRNGLLAAMADLSGHGAGVLLAVRRDRLARSTFLAAGIDRMVKSCGATTRTVHGDFEADTPETQLMRSMVDAFAEYELAMISLRTRMAMRQKKLRGEVVGAVEYGYTAVGEGKVRKVVPDEKEQACLKAIREYTAQGLPYGLMAAKLFANGHTPRNGGVWTPELLKRRKMQLGIHPTQLRAKQELERETGKPDGES